VETADKHVVVLGAGPAGLTTAYLLAQNGRPVTVLEADPIYVGGLARTVSYHGFRFDIGGHRFFSKSENVERLWSEILPNDMLECIRLSRIHFRSELMSYPLRPFEVIERLGVLEFARCILSYWQACVFPSHPAITFEDWAINAFGRRLFEIFFKTYTEKVWGLSCREISADWAAQRIKKMSLADAAFAALRQTPLSRRDTITSLTTSFRYPRLGPGMMWEKCAEKMCAAGGRLLMGRPVQELEYCAQTGRWRIVAQAKNGNSETFDAGTVVSSIPLTDLARMLKPELSWNALQAVQTLRYRDFLSAAVILRERVALQDHWIYVHEPAVRASRIQNYKSWSPALIPEPGLCCLGLEYFCNASDELWHMNDERLLKLALNELTQLGLAQPEDLVDGYVVRQPKAYPVYDLGYSGRVQLVLSELESRFPSLHLVGRNGRHRYNNQDHSMTTAMLSAANILAGERMYNLHKVNEDAEYLEEPVAKYSPCCE